MSKAMHPINNIKDNAAEFIQDTFRPLVGVLCSEEVERHCQKNNLSFVKLIQPFCSISEGNIKDINNIGHGVKNFKIVCHNLNELSVSKLISKKKLNDIISKGYTLDEQLQIYQNHSSLLGVPLDQGSSALKNDHLPSKKSEQNLKTPWYESYRKSFLESLPYSDHEYLRHYIACIIAVSTSEPNPIEQLNDLFQSPAHHPSIAHSNASALTLLHDAKWFVPTFLRFIVLLHDASEQDDMRAEAVYQAVKEKFGNQSCHLLHINSRPLLGVSNQKGHEDETLLNNPWLQITNDNNKSTTSRDVWNSIDPDSITSQNSSSPNHNHPLVEHPLMTTAPRPTETDEPKHRRPPGECLTASDIDRIQSFVYQFVVHSLFPWTERTLKYLNEQTSTRKGIKGSLFNASKWFGRSRPVGQGPSSSSVVYSSDSPEMQLRRLADLAFLFQLYELAYQTYHTIKKDFHNDSAWTHHAGALEMACLSVYLQGSNCSRQYPPHYMEQAIKSYYAGAHSINYAARATMLSTEILRTKNLFAEAAAQFMTVTSEESDLLSALFLEQTAHCFLDMKTPMVRKYAFHMVLAGHRFNKAGQKKHVLRCYAQALEIFKCKGWSLAEDHIYLTIGSQAYHIRELTLATSAYLHLLSPHSKQSANQQAAFFAQYFNIYKQQILPLSPEEMSKAKVEILPLPVVDGKSIRVMSMLSSQPSLEDKVVILDALSDSDSIMRDEIYAKMEERLVAAAFQDYLSFFKPTIFCHSQITNNSSNVLAVVGEPIFVEMSLENPLRIPLTLLNVHPMWKFSPSPTDIHDSDNCISNEPSFQNKVTQEQLNCVNFLTIPEFHLDGSEIKKLTTMLKSTAGNGSSLLSADGGSTHSGSSSISGSSSFVSISGSNITEQDPLSDGLLPQTQSVSNISAVPLTLSTNFSVNGMIWLEVKGNRMNTTKEEKMSIMHSVDRRLHVDAIPLKIKLKMYIYNLPTSMLCGEVVHCRMDFVNHGEQVVTKAILTFNQAELFSFSGEYNKNNPNKEGVFTISLQEGGLLPGQSVSKDLKIKCPELSGKHPLDILVLYSGEDSSFCKDYKNMRYRLIKHSTTIDAQVSLAIASHTFSSPLFSLSSKDSEKMEGSNPSIWSGVHVPVKLENISLRYDFSIAKIISISNQWTLHLHDSLNVKKDLPIKPGEYHLLSLKAHKEASCDGYKDLISSLLFSKEEELLRAFDPSEITNSGPFIPKYPKQHDATLKISGKAEFFLVVLWMAKSSDNSESKKYGRHIMSFGRMEELLESVAIPRSPLSTQIKFTNAKKSNYYLESLDNKDIISQLVKASLHFDSRVIHDFTCKKSFVTQVQVILLNCSDLDLCVSVEADNPVLRLRESVSTDHQLASQMKSFVWVGRTQISLNLCSNQNATHLLKAKIFHSGIYDLQCIKIYVSLKRDKHSIEENDSIFSLPLSNNALEKDSVFDVLSLDHILQKNLSPYLLQVLDGEIDGLKSY